MRDSILFVIPTLFSDPKLTNDCVCSLTKNIKSLDIEYKICVVINESSILFDEYEFDAPVDKMCGNLQFNIARALNTAWRKHADFKYFCFFDEGIRISKEKWVECTIKMFEENPNMGLLGCRPHTSFDYYHKKVSNNPEIYEVLWSDGVLITRIELIKKFAGFDEAYFAECELQDFGYTLHSAGYKNYYWRGLADSHKLIKFEKKHHDRKGLLAVRAESRQRFHSKWSPFERTFGFQTIAEL